MSSLHKRGVSRRSKARIDSGDTPPRIARGATPADVREFPSQARRSAASLACRLGRSWTVPTGDQDPQGANCPGCNPLAVLGAGDGFGILLAEGFHGDLLHDLVLVGAVGPVPGSGHNGLGHFNALGHLAKGRVLAV